MSLKIKSTLNFVKLWPLDNRREEFSLTLLANTKEESDEKISVLIEQTNCIDRNDDNQIVYQVYLKSTESEKSYVASKFNPTPRDIELSVHDLYQYIIKHKLRLVPTELNWVSEDGTPVSFVTHDVYVGKTRYQGMSVHDIIHRIINGYETEAASE